MVDREPPLVTAQDLSQGADVRGVLFVLRVSAGMDVGAAAILDGVGEGRVLVGQSVMCKLRLTDPTVSRRHLALRREDHAWRLTDLGSKNGTRVNGVRIQEAFLGGGEVIAIGGSTLRLARSGVAPVSPLAGSAFGRFTSANEAIRRDFVHWSNLAKTDESILIEGETGTGKEVLAEALHDASPRAARPIVTFDCCGTHASDVARVLPASFEQAERGTLLIDEPADLDLASQELLAATLERLRGDVRIITTTRRDLDREVQAGRFRERLLARLAGATVELLPLRHREGDVAMLTQAFWTRLGGAGVAPADIVARYVDYAWPGNVRELLETVAAHLAVGAEPSAEPPRPSAPEAASRPPPPPVDVISRVLAEDLAFPRARQEVLRELETRFVEKVLGEHGGNVSRAAAASGLARRYFQILKARRSTRA